MNAEPDIAAAEFLLGLLDDTDACAFGEAAARDPALARRVTAWSERLEPLSALATPVEPTPALWLRIAGEVAPVAAPEPPKAAARDGTRRFLRAHPRVSAGVAVALALLGVGAALLAFGASGSRLPPITELSGALPPRALRPVSAGMRLAAVAAPAALMPPTDRTAILGAAAGAGAAAAAGDRPQLRAAVLGTFLLRVEVVRPIPMSPATELGLWVQPRSERTPILIGRVSPGGGTIDLPETIDDGELVIATAEPVGRVSRARPGPVLLQGRFVPAR